MRTMWILSGPSGVGKSTWIKNHMSFFLGKTAVVSRDAIRFSMLKEDDSYFAHEKEVFRSFINAIIYSLNNYEHVIVDATHLNENSRRKLINSIGSENLKETSINVICLKASLDFCLKNNEKRTGLAYVPPASVEKLWHSFVIPKLEDEEYIDKLYIYQIDNPGLGYLIIERS